ncbi:hypothetical protein SLEP1_g12741 [Rubroshorea leprosula]|uniref:Uncharacterized protein n=1 Tax=Rubroshorea leprosula TaxID=152421 RepID=A0AAV5IMA2_9ROSI|nr:hypothetical protein SLEP1_g12741 [Rubroshorea leprosula]
MRSGVKRTGGIKGFLDKMRNDVVLERISTSRCKPRQSYTPPCHLQSRKTLHSPNSSSSKRIFDNILTEADVTRRLKTPASFVSSLPVGFSNSTDLRRKLIIGDVNRILAVPIQTLGTRRSHFEPRRDTGDLNILVKDSTDSVWKFRCSTRVSRELRIVEDCTAFILNQSIQSNNQVVLCEVDLTTRANYRSEATITGLITVIGFDLVLNCPRASYQDGN